MMQKSLLVLLLIVAHITGTAQDKDIVRMLDAHDILYYNRLADIFYLQQQQPKKYYTVSAADVKQRMYSEVERAAILTQAEEKLKTISKLAALRKTYPYTFAQFAMEYYGLKTVIALSAPGVAYDPLMLQYLDSLDHYYKVPKTETEIILLRKEAGIRWESLLETGDKSNLHSLATSHEYGMLRKILRLKFQAAESGGAPGPEDDVIRLLDAHDLLFLSRTTGGYATADQRQKVHKTAEILLSGIKDLQAVVTGFPFLHKAHHTERLYLQSLLLADSAEKSEGNKLFALDTAIRFFLQAPTYPTVAETQRLGKLVGVRRETVSWPSFPDVNELILTYNTIIAQWLVKEYGTYQQTKKANLAFIDSIISLQRPYEVSAYQEAMPGNELQKAVDKAFLTAQEIGFYFKSREALLENNCDRILLYMAGWKLSQTLTSLHYIDASLLLDSSIQKVVDSLGLPCATGTLTGNVKNELEQQVREWQQKTNLQPPDIMQSGGPRLSDARFPFPPPEPSRRTQPLELKGSPRTWRDADRLLMAALAKANYNQVSYYGINGGFAVVTPLEQLKENAAPKSDPPRYEVKVSLREEFSFTNYLKALFFGEKGFYRVLVFMFTDQPIAPQAKSSGDVVLHLPPGLDRLPDEDGYRPYTPRHRCTVLVYEFEKAKGDPAKFIKPGRFDVKTHLLRTLIWNHLFY